MFIAQSVDVTAGIQYGSGYVLLGGSPPPVIGFQGRSPTSGSFYQLTSAATFQWTNDVFTPQCTCKMQYVRVYTDYAPSQQDQFISMALMNPDSNRISFIISASYKTLNCS